MQILTQSLREQLLANGRQQQPLRGTGGEIDFIPVVKLFTPDAGATWLLTEINPEDPDIAVGLCDLGLGCPEIGNVSLSELSSLRGPLGLPVERDLYFRPDKPLSTYANEARRLGRIRA
ncbi:transposase [Mesorhizobium loti]|uniref:Transposase n=1 Tax=Rhizobium loti TaxID=381 RepID=A0A101KQS1_RHILI|nr:transposase [Mesorhizobium loti]